jgi:hypothetical protein
MPDAALAIIGDGISQTPRAQASAELFQFARRHGLSFISDDRKRTGDLSDLINGRVNERETPSFPSDAPFQMPEGNGSRDLTA